MFGFSQFFCVPTTDSSGGLLLLCKDDIDINIVGNHFFINCLVCDKNATDSSTWQLTLVYGPHVSFVRLIFWDDLNLLGDFFTGLWLMVGDFNTVLS